MAVFDLDHKKKCPDCQKECSIGEMTIEKAPFYPQRWCPHCGAALSPIGNQTEDEYWQKTIRS